MVKSSTVEIGRWIESLAHPCGVERMVEEKVSGWPGALFLPFSANTLADGDAVRTTTRNGEYNNNNKKQNTPRRCTHTAGRAASPRVLEPQVAFASKENRKKIHFQLPPYCASLRRERSTERRQKTNTDERTLLSVSYVYQHPPSHAALFFFHIHHHHCAFWWPPSH